MGKHLVVLGGAGLLGNAICLSAAQAGHQVVVADFDESRAERICRQIIQSGNESSFCKFDVTSSSSILRLIEHSTASFGQISAVVNSTYLRGRGYGRKLSKMRVEDFCETISLQLGSLFLVYQAFSDYFVSVGGGSLVSIGSIYGAVAPRFSIYEGTEMSLPVEYAVTKSGLRQLNKYYAQCFKKQSVRFNIVSPGGILDGQPDCFLKAYGDYCGSKGMLDPEDVVAAVLYLVSSESRFVTGQELFVDDGFSL